MKKFHPSAIAVNHAAVAAGKGQQRHQIPRQVATDEVALESKQVARAMTADPPHGHRAAFPRSAGGNDQRCRYRPAAFLRRDVADPAAAAALQAGGAPGLPQRCSGARRGLQQQQIEMFAADGSAPAAAYGIGDLRHCKRELGFACKETGAPHHRSGKTQNCFAQAEFPQQWQAGGRNILSAHLASRERSLFDNSYGPARLCQHQRCRATSRASADHDCVVCLRCSCSWA